MKNKIEDYIYVANYIPQDLCEELINECNKGKWQEHQWTYEGSLTKVSKELDKNLYVLNSTKEQGEKIFPYIDKAIEDYQKIYSWMSAKTRPPWLHHLKHIRFNKYEVGSYMDMHHDHIHSIFDGKLKGIPILSIVGNLNDTYEGSEFYCRGQKIILKTGDILIFPSNFMYPHEVKKTTKGTRYSFVSWAF